MIYITGDTHGLVDFPKLKNYFSKRYCSEKDYLIILGDVGIAWSEEDDDYFQYSCLGPTVLFIDGNHENFNLLNQFPVITRFGAKVHYITDNIYHVLRGEILSLNGLSFLCLGGATSTDKAYRKLGVSYWDEEHILDSDIENALTNIKRYNGCVDYVLTHCAPTLIAKSMFEFGGDKDTLQLDKLQSQIAYSHWYFGHYHVDQTKGRYRCFYQDILEINRQNHGKREIKYHLLTLEREDVSPYLKNWETGRRTRLTIDDLPEWFFGHYSYGFRFYDLSNVTDVAYEGSPFDNHISKDSRIYLSYNGKHPKRENQSPVDENDWEYHTWRASVVDIILGLEKYSPNLDLSEIKAQINLTYDQYLNNPSNYFGSSVSCRPFPEITSPRYRERFGDRIAQYAVYHGKRILATFIEKETAVAYAEAYLKKNLRIEIFHYQEPQKGDCERAYDTGRCQNEWLFIHKLAKDA